MRILIVLNVRPEQGGITGAIEELYKSLVREGYLCEVATTHGGTRDRFRNILGVFKRAKGFDLILAAGSVYYGFLPILIGVTAARIHKKKFLVNFHSADLYPFMKYFGRLFRLFIGKAPLIVATGYLFEVFAHYNFNVFLIPNFFCFEDFPKRQESFVWNNKFIWVGQFIRAHDPETILEACNLVLQKRNDVEFHFFGNGPLLNGLRIKYNHPRVKFHGFIPRSVLLKEYQFYSCLLNSHLYDNFPLRLIEASFNELLVITTVSGGVPSVFHSGECVFYEKKDSLGLSKLIISVSGNPSLYDSYRMTMHEKTMTFTWDFVREHWLKLIMSNFNNN